MKFSYNDNSPANVRIPGEEAIRFSYFTRNLNLSADGELYCSADVNISGWSQSKEVFKYDPTQSYYILLASGFTDTQGLLPHKHTFVSTPRLLDADNSVDGFNNSTCGTTKGCFISKKSNAMAVSYKITAPGFMQIQLTMKTAATSSVYLAVGFSLDNSMGNDNVIECSALTGESLSMKFSYNAGKNNVRIKGEETIRAQYFQNETATITDGTLYCSATVDVRGWASSNGQVFTYNENQTYYLLLAAGSALSTSLAQHKITEVSSPRRLSDYGVNSGDGGMSSTTKMRLIKAHAILMLLAWFFFIPTAAMFARFLRASWPTLKPGGMLIWFHVHRTCNTLAIILTIASFICIFTANNWNWTGPGTVLHAYLLEFVVVASIEPLI
ncbi:DOMON domain protein [Oesophagostomum dentatum]|uniref:DOMON domain protein n=1 Tax=Oesophagostomum dentatum TaxID=61180 RepID=A0A0B1SPA6_OESDE|nr:DOMON domain protein [Oesophagostomum dentatum]